MSLFPRIQSPCPYWGNLADIMDGTSCRLCKREVYDIGAMDEAQRIALIAGCSDEICVSYSLAAKTVLAAAAMGAGFGLSNVAAAQATERPPVAAVAPAEEEMWIIVGGLKAPREAVWIDVRKPATLAHLPVVYEERAAKKKLHEPDLPRGDKLGHDRKEAVESAPAGTTSLTNGS